MATVRNTYAGGIDTDSSNSKMSVQKLRDLVDLRIYTNKGETSLGLSSVKGNLKLLSMPSIYIRPIRDGIFKGDNLPAGHSVLLTETQLPQYNQGKIIITTATSATGISNANTLQYSYFSNKDTKDLGTNFIAGSTQKIIGWTTVRDDLILFCSTNIADNPTGGFFSIWRITYDDNLNYTNQMMYVGRVPHTAFHMIEAVSRYENSKVAKVYWTDGVQTVKHFNLNALSPQDTWTSALEFSPFADMYAPTFKEWSTGEPSVKGMVQYAYSLYSVSGSETKISPFSLPLYVKDVKPIMSFYADVAFENMRIYRIEYASYQAMPILTLMIDKSYNANVSNLIEFVDNGEKLSTLSLLEFALTGGNPKVVESLVEKDNRLFLGNIKESSFDPTWDSRAYRFDSSRNAEIHMFNGNSIDGYGFTREKQFSAPNPSYPDLGEIEKTFDCFQKCNLDNTVYGYNGDSVYQEDGVTVGGEGPNIKYSFGTNAVKRLSTREANDSAYKDRSPNDKTQAGYKRMEIYRFGIQFINQYGQVSFVNWIADIKFPTSEMDDGTNTYTPYLNVALKSFPAGWNYYWKWRIVRSKRGKSDRTIATQGFMTQAIIPSQHLGEGDITKVVPDAYNIPNLYTQPFLGPAFKDPNSTWGSSTNPSIRQQGLIAEYGINTLVNQENEYITPDKNDGDYFYPIAEITSAYYNRQTVRLADSNFVLNIDIEATSLTVHAQDHDSTYVPGKIEVMTVPNKLYDLDGYKMRNSMWTLERFIVSLKNKQQVYIASGGTAIAWTSSGHPGGSGNFTNTKSPIVDFRKKLRSQYGGYRWDQRNLTSYIPCSTPTNRSTNIILGGDTYTALNRVLKYNYDPVWDGNDNDVADYDDNALVSNKQIVEVTLETTISPAFESEQDMGVAGKLEISREEFYTFDHVYRQEQNFPTYVVKPRNFNEITEFDFLVRASEPKFNNEIIDSFTRHRTNLFLETDPKYGPIRKLINHNDKVIAFQETGIVNIVINPRVQTTSTDGQSIQLGVGQILHDINYISTKSGTKNKFSVFSSKKNIYFYDTLQNKIKIVSQDLDVSDIKNIHGKLKLINFPDDYSKDQHLIHDSGVYGMYDPEFSEALFSFRSPNISETMVLVLNEKSGIFTHSYRYEPSLLINDSKNLLSVTDGDPSSIYMHNRGTTSSYYGQNATDSYFHILVNGESELSKIFDNWAFNMEAYDASGNDLPNVHPKACRVYNDYQDSGIVPFVNRGNIRRLQRTWEANIPRQQSSRLTMRGPWINIIFYFDNNNDYTYVMHDLHTKYRP